MAGLGNCEEFCTGWALVCVLRGRGGGRGEETGLETQVGLHHEGPAVTVQGGWP